VNEEALFAAYRNLDRADPDMEAARIEERYERQGMAKCIIPSCLTLIAIYTNRSLCRFHEGKRRRGEM
jgi:hypothetical protein